MDRWNEFDGFTVRSPETLAKSTASYFKIMRVIEPKISERDEAIAASTSPHLASGSR